MDISGRDFVKKREIILPDIPRQNPLIYERALTLHNTSKSSIDSLPRDNQRKPLLMSRKKELNSDLEFINILD